MALVGIELETLVSEPDALTTQPPPKMTCGKKIVTNTQMQNLRQNCKFLD